MNDVSHETTRDFIITMGRVFVKKRYFPRCTCHREK